MKKILILGIALFASYSLLSSRASDLEEATTDVKKNLSSLVDSVKEVGKAVEKEAAELKDKTQETFLDKVQRGYRSTLDWLEEKYDEWFGE